MTRPVNKWNPFAWLEVIFAQQLQVLSLLNTLIIKVNTMSDQDRALSDAIDRLNTTISSLQTTVTSAVTDIKSSLQPVAQDPSVAAAIVKLDALTEKANTMATDLQEAIQVPVPPVPPTPPNPGTVSTAPSDTI